MNILNEIKKFETESHGSKNAPSKPQVTNAFFNQTPINVDGLDLTITQVSVGDNITFQGYTACRYYGSGAYAGKEGTGFTLAVGSLSFKEDGSGKYILIRKMKDGEFHR